MLNFFSFSILRGERRCKSVGAQFIASWWKLASQAGAIHCAPTYVQTTARTSSSSLSCQPNRRAGKALYHRRDLLQTASGSSQGIKRLKAGQCKEHINSLVEGLTEGGYLLLDQPLSDRTYSLSSPFVSCPYHLLEIWVEGSQSAQPAH